MKSPIVRSVLRAVRVALAVAAGQFLASLTEQPELIMVAPLLNAAFKFVRDVNPKLWWIPV